MLIAAYQRSRLDKYVDQRGLRTKCWGGPIRDVINTCRIDTSLFMELR